MPVGLSHALNSIYAPRAYEPTKKIWTEVYDRLIKNNDSVKGTTYIGPLEGNGHKDRLHKNKARDTIVFIPESTSLESPVDLIFYFHGLGGFKERDFKTRVLKHTRAIDAARNYVIIIPEMPWSKNTSTPRTRQGRVFIKKGSFSVFVNSALRVIRAHFAALPQKLSVGNVMLVGHSAGGSALMSISRSGGIKWVYIEAEAMSVRVIFSDASYGYWLDIAWKYCEPHVDADINFLIMTRRWDRPHKHAKRFLKKFKTVPYNIQHIVFSRKTTHSDIGDQALSWAYLDEEGCGC